MTLREELTRIHDLTSAIAKRVHSMDKTHWTMKTEINLQLKEVNRRITFVERIVFGACAILLISVLTALVQGTITFPGILPAAAQDRSPK